MTRGTRRQRLIDRLAAVGGSAAHRRRRHPLTAGIATAAATANSCRRRRSGRTSGARPRRATRPTCTRQRRRLRHDHCRPMPTRATASACPSPRARSSAASPSRPTRSRPTTAAVLSVRLSGDAGSSWTGYLQRQPHPDRDGRPGYGGAADPWGRSGIRPSPNANFRIELRNINGSNCADRSTTSVDWIDVTVTYTTMDEGTANAALTGSVCKSGDFNFIIDMSGSIGAQGNLPSNLQQLKDGVNGFVNAFEAARGERPLCRAPGSTAAPPRRSPRATSRRHLRDRRRRSQQPDRA